MITLELKQITPLIHFQADQSGATLRASEVKPALDRFIHLFCSRQKFTPPEAWYMPKKDENEGKAFRYKMRIFADGEPACIEPHPLFFGNMGDRNQRKQAIMFGNCPVRVQILCMTDALENISENEALSKLMKKTGIGLEDLLNYVIKDFFSLHCFGTRSTKGFGSFLVINNNRTTYKAEAQRLKLYTDNAYMLRCEGVYSLDAIWVVSGMMKSGFNLTMVNAPHPERNYLKGGIMKYLGEQIGSDKAYVKENVIEPIDRVDFGNHHNADRQEAYTQYRYTRAMLGLMPKADYKLENDPRRRLSVYVLHPEIRRFASPVQYKPLDDNGEILVLPQKIPDAMYGKAFCFNKRVKEYNKLTEAEKEKCVSTPSKEEFNLIDYLDWFCGQFPNDNFLKRLCQFNFYGWHGAESPKPGTIQQAIYDFKRIQPIFKRIPLEDKEVSRK